MPINNARAMWKDLLQNTVNVKFSFFIDVSMAKVLPILFRQYVIERLLMKDVSPLFIDYSRYKVFLLVIQCYPLSSQQTRSHP